MDFPELDRIFRRIKKERHQSGIRNEIESVDRPFTNSPHPHFTLRKRKLG
jgi:hypothetical protein